MLTQQVSIGMPDSCLLSPWSSLWVSELLLPQIPPVALRRGVAGGERWVGEVAESITLLLFQSIIHSLLFSSSLWASFFLT